MKLFKLNPMELVYCTSYIFIITYIISQHWIKDIVSAKRLINRQTWANDHHFEVSVLVFIITLI